MGPRYLAGATTREIAAEYGVNESTVRVWLRAEGVPMRARGPRSTAPDDVVVTLRRRQRMTWPQIAAATGMSVTGARSAYRRVTGGVGSVDHRGHLTARQADRLRRLAEEVPPVDRGRGLDRVCEEARRLRESLAAHHAAGVSCRELGEVVGLSGNGVRAILTRHVG